MKYKVTAPKGATIGGVSHKHGETFEGERKNAHIGTALHFRQIVEVKDEESAGGAGNGPLASEAAKALAAEKGIDLATITGTGANGSITKPDVEAAIEAAKSAGGAGN